MGYPEEYLTEGEKIITEFRPHWKSLVIPVVWTVVFIAALVLALTLVPDDGPLRLIVVAILVVGWLVVAVGPFVNWFFTLHVLTTERLVVRSGVVARRGLEIPLEAINDVTFSQTVFERLLGFGDLLVESAGEQGQSRFSNIPRPEHFQSLIYRNREDRSKELSGAGDAAADALGKLAELHRQGVLTDEEFAEKKEKLLREI